MRILKIMLITLVLCSVSVFSLSCASKSTSATQNKVVAVQRGNLTINITASGNLALSVTQDLAFEIAGTAQNPLTVAEVLVAVGESVGKGQVLARADTSAWQVQLTTLEGLVKSAERNVPRMQLALLQAQINLNSAQLALEQAQQGTTTTKPTTDPLQIELKQMQLELAQGQLEVAQTALDDAQTAVDDAEKALKDAQDASLEVIAPFAGFITNVNVKGGAAITKGMVAVTIADPNKFEANILVSEMDIQKVKVGGAATVQASAYSGINLPAKVTYISPTATIQQGVVNYSVTVEVESLETVMQGQVSAVIPQNFKLSQGMTVTVSIMVSQRTDVLLVPNGAITRRSGQAYVQVVAADGTTEERSITTGLNDYQYTEVTDGLSEGEKVIVPQGTTTTSTTSASQQQGPGGGFNIQTIPGIGGIGR